MASPRDEIFIESEKLEEEFPEGIDILLMEKRLIRLNNVLARTGLCQNQRYRGVLVQVLIASSVVQLFSLANPLLIQVIIESDFQGVRYLQVLGIGLVIVTVLGNSKQLTNIFIHGNDQ